MSMNNELWQKVLNFDFDGPGDYTFSIRLAKENHWTRNFTQQALLEYRKFMYLAATSGSMVSPSEIVDIVWHQHLIFTQSYTEFCTLLGRQIQHIPSTHNKQEAETFKQAKEHTTRQYNSVFGAQPKAIWEYNDMFEPLNLPQAKHDIRATVTIGLVLFLLLLVPTYYCLMPLYIHISGPAFVTGFALIILAAYTWISNYNRNKLLQIITEADESAFVFNLQPYELVYLKTQSPDYVVHGSVNELIVRNAITINEDKSVTLNEDAVPEGREQAQVVDVLNEFKWIPYPGLLKLLVNKPVFSSIANAMDAFRNYFTNSEKFAKLFRLNFIIGLLLLLTGYTRFFTGVSRNKPVMYIFLLNIALTIGVILHLKRFKKEAFKTTIPNLYTTKSIPQTEVNDNWQWRYLAEGTAVLYPVFIPIAQQKPEAGTWGDGGSGGCGSSGGDGGGGSCGGGCGGCGGGD
ncbi:glycine-rich domain-containing protein [Flavobacterium sp. RHBU_24]|uniref:glycine-rich domain-containing protein n=1 Tax=Flavobacterium sp. RHBU_24 TaxID=3391185 RepID=UPI003984CA6E